MNRVAARNNPVPSSTELDGYRGNETKRVNCAKAVANREKVEVSWDHPSILSRHMLALSVCQRGKKRIEREGIIIETKRVAYRCFEIKQRICYDDTRGYIYFQKKKRKKNSNGPFQAENSFGESLHGIFSEWKEKRTATFVIELLACRQPLSSMHLRWF